MADINDLLNMSGPSQKPDPMSSIMSMAGPLAAKGEEALQSGAITMKQAKAAQKKLGLDNPQSAQATLSKLILGDKPAPEQGDALTQLIQTGNAKTSLFPPSPQAPQEMPNSPMPKPVLPSNSGGLKPGAKNVQSKSEQTATQMTDEKKTRNVFASDDEANKVMDIWRHTPEAESQSKGITDMEALLHMAQSKQHSGDSWIKPLLALSDSVNGGNQAGAFEPQAAKQKEALLKFANEIQQRKGDYSKSILDTMAKLKTGTDSSNEMKKLMELQALNSGQGGAGSLANSRLAMIPIRAGQDFDKQILQNSNSVEALNRSQGFLDDKSVPLTEQSLNMAQQEVSKALTQSGAPTDSKIAMDMQHTIQGIIANAKAKWTGQFDPQKDDLRTQVPEIVAQIRKVIQKARADYQDSINRQAEQIKKTYEPSYGSIPNLRETVEGKHQAIKERFPLSGDYNKTGVYEASKDPLQPSVAAIGSADGKTGGGKFVAPKGPKSSWTKADLDAYEAHLHGGGAPVGAG